MILENGTIKKENSKLTKQVETQQRECMLLDQINLWKNNEQKYIYIFI